MKNIFSLLYNTYKHYEAKKFLNLKNKLIISYLTKIFLIFFLLNTGILLPLFWQISIVIAIIVYLFINILTIFLLFLNYQLKAKFREKLDKIIINTSIPKADFTNYLKNDIVFNLKAGFFISLLLSLYQIILYSLIKILPLQLKLSFYVLADITYFSVFFIGCTIGFLIYYIKNRDTKVAFSKVGTIRRINKNYFLNSLIFAISLILFIIVFRQLFNQVLIYIFLAFLSASIILFLFNFIFIKKGIIKKTNFSIWFSGLQNRLNDYRNNLQTTNFFQFLKSVKLIYPLIFAALFFLIITCFNSILLLTLKLRFFQSILFGMLFTYPLFNMANKKKLDIQNVKPFIFTGFLASIFIALIFISAIKINLTLTHDSLLFIFKDFIYPLVIGINNFCLAIKNNFNAIPFPAVILFPILFALFFFFNKKLFNFFHYIGRLIDLNLRKKLTKKTPSIIFGDAISLYPFLFIAFRDLLIIAFLVIEIAPLSTFFYNLFTTFQIAEIFKFKFLTYVNITGFFNFILIFSVTIIIIKLIHLFISSILSHFILFNDEIIYYENKFYKKTILRIPINRVNYIIIKQNLLEKIFDIGSVFIETIDKNGVIKIKGVSSLKEKNILIMDKIKGDI